MNCPVQNTHTEFRWMRLFAHYDNALWKGMNPHILWLNSRTDCLCMVTSLGKGETEFKV